MNFFKYKLFNGKGYITIQNKNNDSNAHWGEIKDIFIAQIKIPFTNYAIALRKRNVTAFSDYGLERIKSLFGQYNYKVHKFEVIRINKSKDSQNDVFYMLNYIWMLNPKYNFICCKNPQVMFSRKSHKYYGYSHRGGAFFGIGDMLFDENKDNETLYYRNKSFRIQFIKYLIKYINSPFDFEDLVNSGIKSIVPFKCRGSKTIEDMQEAYIAASNFAKYLS